MLLGAGMSVLFAGTGFVGGMSTVFTAVWSFFSRAPYFREARFLSSRGWRLAYAAGGFIGGFGARLSNGCTAGHGICGIASLQPASILSVAIFLATAMATAHLVRALA